MHKRESTRWHEMLQKAEEVQKEAPETEFIVVGDRESDTYDVLSYQGKVQWLVRGNQDRCLKNQEGKRLKERVAQQTVVSKISFTTHKGMYVEQDIRACRVQIQRPKDRKKSDVPIEPVVTAVLCTQTNHEPNTDPIEWLLLSSVELTETLRPETLVSWYLARWEIEMFFKVLKSGCHVEKLKLETCERLMRYLFLYLVIAWRILFVTKMGRICHEEPCSVLFTDLEWKVAYVTLYKKALPKDPPSCQEMMIMVAKLGGFLGRKSDGHPGIITTWRGLTTLHFLVMGAASAQLLNTCV